MLQPGAYAFREGCGRMSSMFEQYTQNARRVIFFARYEASPYGNATIETEHLPLGLLREDQQLMSRLLSHDDVASGIRTEIEKGVTVGQRVPPAWGLLLSLDFCGEPTGCRFSRAILVRPRRH
jgi:ATP-dependent Clp protease ATP-binding subunit ClpC